MSVTLSHLVVVHGIGDQKRNETALGFLNEFVRAMPEELRASVEVHSLLESSTRVEDRPAFIVADDNGTRRVIAISEVYWQDITNGFLEQNGGPPIPVFTWAHSINLRLLKGGGGYRKAREAIENLEMMLALLKRLATIYKKSGLLATILERFLGDVQMYTESAELREHINGRFLAVLDRDQAIADALKTGLGVKEWDARGIVVVAHSEGTVVSYNSLVKAAAEREKDPACRDWLLRVRALVTLGSPIDKHYTIWTQRFRTDELRATGLNPKIRWFNFWDRSDPVGYGLAALRPQDPGSDAGRMFEVHFDAGFSRYPIPGMAHVDYWTDADLHRNILHNALGIGNPTAPTMPSRWWGHEWLMQGLDYAAYAAGRVVTIAVMLFFLARLIDPQRWRLQEFANKLSVLHSGFGSAARPQGTQLLAILGVIVLPAVVLKVWNDLDQRGDAETQTGMGFRGIFLSGWLVVVAATMPWLGSGSSAFEIKNWLGYAMGLFVTMTVWKLHSTVHKGIVQMWRYTGGAGSGTVSAATAPAKAAAVGKPK